MTELTLELSVAPDPRIGSVLADRYRIVRKLGEGGMGIVYEGLHTVIGRRVAIKMLHAQFATSADIVARFHREAVSATAIGHPHIVEVIDMARAPDGAVFMVLEFLEGRDWAHDLADTGPQSLGRVARILVAVCDALAAAHAKKIVHRDLKPENVFLVSRPKDPDFVKLVDFGISKMLDEPPGHGGKGLTQTGAAMGTPYYMAPEQMAGRKDIDHRADLYSVGVMLYQAVTGSYPFDGETIAMLALKVLSTDPPPLSAYLVDVPEGLQTVIDRTLAREPADRFASAGELRDALSRWLDDPRAPIAKVARSELATLPVVAGIPEGTHDDDRRAAAHHATRAASTREMPGQAAAPRPAVAPIAAAPIAAAPIAAVPIAPLEARPPSSAGPRLALAIALVVVVLLGVLALSRLDGPEAAAETVPHEPPVIAGVEATPDVHIVITTTPAGADLRLDGLAVANPFDGELPRSRDAHHLEARAVGFVPIDREITLLTDQRITLTLEPSSAADVTALAPPPDVPSTRPHHPPREPATHVGEVVVTVTPPPVVAPAPEPPPTREETAPPSERLLKRPF